MEAARSLPQERVRIALANREYVLSREADHVLAEAGIEFEVSSLLRRNDGLPVVLLESSTPSQLGVGGIVWCLGELGAVTLRDTTHRAYGGAQRPLATARRLAALEPQCTYLDVFEASASLREREQRFRDLNLELDVVASNEEDARMLRAAKALLDEAWFVASHDAEWNAYVAARAKRA